MKRLLYIFGLLSVSTVIVTYLFYDPAQCGVLHPTLAPAPASGGNRFQPETITCITPPPDYVAIGLPAVYVGVRSSGVGGLFGDAVEWNPLNLLANLGWLSVAAATIGVFWPRHRPHGPRTSL